MLTTIFSVYHLFWSFLCSSGMLTTGKKYSTRTHVCLDFYKEQNILCIQKAWKHQLNKLNLDEKSFCNLFLWMNITTVVMPCATDAKKMSQFNFLKIDFIVRKWKIYFLMNIVIETGTFLENLPTSLTIQKWTNSVMYIKKMYSNQMFSYFFITTCKF